MKRWFVLWLLVAAFLAGCGVTGSGTSTMQGDTPRELRIMTYGSFDISDEVVAQFEETHNARLRFLDAGDTGQMVSQAILTKDNPEADVMYGIDNTFLSRALEANLFVPYESERLGAIPDDLDLDPQHRVSPVDYGDVCLNYDRAYFEEREIPVPQSLEDLADPAYKGLLVAENPASSSPGLAFLLATISTLGEDVYLDYWEQLRENDVLIVENWDNAYYNEFSGGVNGAGVRPIVVSYATSPAAEVYFSEEELDTSPTGAVVAPGTCFRQIEFVGILKNGESRDLAEAFVDYVLSDTWQNDIPLHMFVFPASETATLPEVFATHAIRAVSPATMSVDRIEDNRQAWIDAWTDVVLR